MGLEAGCEQAGHRPVLSLSSKLYNSKTKLLICVLITSLAQAFLLRLNFSIQPYKELHWPTKSRALTGRCVMRRIKG